MNTSFFSSFPFLGSFAPTCEHSISMMMVLLISIYYIPSTARQVFQDLPLYKRIRWITVWAVPIHANSIWYLVFLKRHARDTWRSIHAIVLQIRCDGYACPDHYKDNCKNGCCNCDSCESRYHLFGPNFAECLADIQVVPYTLDTIVAFLLDLELPHYINSCLRLTIFINSDALGTRNSAEMAVSIALARVSNEINSDLLFLHFVRIYIHTGKGRNLTLELSLNSWSPHVHFGAWFLPFIHVSQDLLYRLGQILPDRRWNDRIFHYFFYNLDKCGVSHLDSNNT